MSRPCLSCGAPFDDDVPQPNHCGSCLPWTCDGCGRPCSMTEPCGCWISLDGLALADIKGLLALGDLSASTPSDGGES